MPEVRLRVGGGRARRLTPLGVPREPLVDGSLSMSRRIRTLLRYLSFFDAAHERRVSSSQTAVPFNPPRD